LGFLLATYFGLATELADRKQRCLPRLIYVEQIVGR
jgi:hypothetical protein